MVNYTPKYSTKYYFGNVDNETKQCEINRQKIKAVLKRLPKHKQDEASEILNDINCSHFPIVDKYGNIIKSTDARHKLDRYLSKKVNKQRR